MASSRCLSISKGGKGYSGLYVAERASDVTGLVCGLWSAGAMFRGPVILCICAVLLALFHWPRGLFPRQPNPTTRLTVRLTARDIYTDNHLPDSRAPAAVRKRTMSRLCWYDQPTLGGPEGR